MYKLLMFIPLIFASLVALGGYLTISSLWKSFENKAPAEAEFAKNFVKAGFKHAASKL